MPPKPVDNSADHYSRYYSRWDALKGWGLKYLIGSGVPARYLYGNLALPPLTKTDEERPFSLEIVSHCWQYAHLLRYQLSSIVLHVPDDIDVTVSIYYCESDLATAATLDYFKAFKLSNVRWNWQSFPKESLFRRSIGRNHAALNTRADWIWFTDCDVIFHQDCLRSLAKHCRGRQSPLVYPLVEHRSRPLPAEHADLRFDVDHPALIDIEPENFVATEITRATGPLQIVHAEVARKLGYCRQSAIYQKPAQQWCKALEDRLFRSLLGTQGDGVPIQGVYRLQHQEKGRYRQDSVWSWVRAVGQGIKTHSGSTGNNNAKKSRTAASPDD